MTFENFVSLGWYCGVAASLDKLGLRNTSGPFDWYCSDFKGIIECLQNDFDDFLAFEYLQIDKNNSKNFCNKKYNFTFTHEIHTTLEDNYENICSKYIRRIKRFRNDIKNKTCFIRAISNLEEYRFIKNNLEYINSVIKKQNNDNEIIYCMDNTIIEKEEVEYPYFKVNKYCGNTQQTLRTLFDGCFIQDWLIKNSDVTIRNNNLYYRYNLIMKNELKIPDEYFKLKYDYDNLLNIENINPEQCSVSTPQVIIYGCGLTGKSLYRKIKNLTNCLYFIDINAPDCLFDNIPVINLNDFANLQYDETPIIITPYGLEQISFNLSESHENVCSVSVIDFINKYVVSKTSN